MLIRTPLEWWNLSSTTTTTTNPYLSQLPSNFQHHHYHHKHLEHKPPHANKDLSSWLTRGSGCPIDSHWLLLSLSVTSIITVWRGHLWSFVGLFDRFFVTALWSKSLEVNRGGGRKGEWGWFVYEALWHYVYNVFWDVVWRRESTKRRKKFQISEHFAIISAYLPTLIFEGGKKMMPRTNQNLYNYFAEQNES